MSAQVEEVFVDPGWGGQVEDLGVDVGQQMLGRGAGRGVGVDGPAALRCR